MNDDVFVINEPSKPQPFTLSFTENSSGKTVTFDLGFDGVFKLADVFESILKQHNVPYERTSN